MSEIAEVSSSGGGSSYLRKPRERSWYFSVPVARVRAAATPISPGLWPGYAKPLHAKTRWSRAGCVNEHAEGQKPTTTFVTGSFPKSTAKIARLGVLFPANNSTTVSCELTNTVDVGRLALWGAPWGESRNSDRGIVTDSSSARTAKLHKILVRATRRNPARTEFW
jgi:hypothetical protein